MIIGSQAALFDDQRDVRGAGDDGELRFRQPGQIARHAPAEEAEERDHVLEAEAVGIGIDEQVGAAMALTSASGQAKSVAPATFTLSTSAGKSSGFGALR